MSHEFFIPAPEGCEAFQWQLSETADSGAAPSPELRAHLAACAACQQFAEQWLDGPPAALARPASGPVDPRLRARILAASVLPPVIRFPTPARTGLPWTPSLVRAAACLALGGFAFWLLNPVASPVRVDPPQMAGPTLTEGVTQLETKTRNEQKVLQNALVDGGRRVSGTVAWSVSALEL